MLRTPYLGEFVLFVSEFSVYKILFHKEKLKNYKPVFARDSTKPALLLQIQVSMA